MRRALPFFYLALFSMGFIACGEHRDTTQKSVLLFNGAGASPNDVAALEAILYNNQITYKTVNSDQLNEMDQPQLLKYRLLIISGGNFIEIGKSLDQKTSTKIRNSVHHGLNYLGICAGGFLAGNSAYYNGLNLSSGVRFGFYSIANRGIRKAAVPIAFADRSVLEQYWEDGPQFSGWGSVIGKYPDGAPAIVQGFFGKGKVLLCGTHPEAPQEWRQGMTFNTSAKIDNDYAAKLIRAGLNQTVLPHYPKPAQN